MSLKKLYHSNLSNTTIGDVLASNHSVLIKVKAENGSIRTYTLNITRKSNQVESNKSSINTLKSLVLSDVNINFNSNNQTMQLFMQHQAEFKASLVNMGFSELSMNFSDSANKEQNQGENKRQKFNINEDEQTEQSQSEETVLEVVLPKYF